MCTRNGHLGQDRHSRTVKPRDNDRLSRTVEPGLLRCLFWTSSGPDPLSLQPQDHGHQCENGTGHIATATPPILVTGSPSEDNGSYHPLVTGSDPVPNTRPRPLQPAPSRTGPHRRRVRKEMRNHCASPGGAGVAYGRLRVRNPRCDGGPLGSRGTPQPVS